MHATVLLSPSNSLRESESASKRLKSSPRTAKGLVIELCAGSAMLSRCFSEYGFETLPIDHAANRFQPQQRFAT